MLFGFAVADEITIGCARGSACGQFSQCLRITANGVTFGNTVGMKTCLIFAGALGLLMSLIPCAQGQNGQAGSLNSSMKCGVSADDRALREIPERWRAAYNEGKAEQVAELYTEDAYYLTQHFVTGILHGREEIQGYVQRGVDGLYHIDAIEVLGTQCSGDFAYAITRYRSTNAGRNDLGVNLVVLRKREGGRIEPAALRERVGAPCVAHHSVFVQPRL